MNIYEMADMKKFEKFFVDQSGEIYSTDDLHERLAREICEEKNWKWNLPGICSAVDFLLKKKGFIKGSNYGESYFRYVAMSINFSSNKHVVENAEYISQIFNLRIEIN